MVILKRLKERAFSRLQTQLQAEGYTPYIDPIDREIVAEYRCPECGKRGLEARGYRRIANHVYSYRVFACCVFCGVAEEF